MLALVTVSAPALSQDAGWFIGAGGGGTKFENGCSTFTGPGTCDDNGIFWKVFGGYQFASFFGFEVGYADFGKSEQTATGVGSSTIEANGAEAVLVLTVPFTQGFGIYGKYGIYRWNVEKVVTGPNAISVDTSGTDITYGFGMKYDLTKNLALRAEWQRYQNMGDAFTGDFDVDAGLFGIVFKF
jgi:OOP family OmpA-OmpF porin